MNADIQGELFNFSTEREESPGILMYQSGIFYTKYA